MNRVRISNWQKTKRQYGNYLHIRKGLAILCVFVMVLQFGNIAAYAASIDGEKGTFTGNEKSVTLPVTNGEITTEEAADEEIDNTTEQVTEVSTEENEEQTPLETGDSEKETTEASTENNSGEETTESGNGNEAEISTKEDNSQDIPENKESKSEIVVSGGIQIDGLYDDWDDIPKTDITYDSNNADCVHYGQMYTDGTNIYAHFQTNALYTNPMQIHLWYLTIDGQQFALQIQPESNGSIDWGTQIPSSEGTHTNLKVFIGYGSNNECDSNVVFTIYDESHASDTPGDDIEFSFSMERLSELTGIPVDQMGTITLSNPNLGGGGVTIAGSSTGPVIGVVAAFILAAAFLRKRNHSKREAL